MGATYGAFLLSSVPADAVETDAQCIALLEQLARRGLCPLFREIINGRVIEFQYDARTQTTAYQWLEDGEAVLALYETGGVAPYSYYEFLEDVGTLLTPGGATEDDISLLLESGGEVDFKVMPASQAIAAIQQVSHDLQTPERYSDNHRHPLSTYLDFHSEIVEGIEEGIKAGVLYILGEG